MLLLSAIGVLLRVSSYGAGNLAAAASYECVVAPNYWGWKLPQHGDTGQLTDGVTVDTWDTEQGTIYALASSMGWINRPPVILFDLGESKAIGGIGLHTVLSFWGPWWPDELSVLVSDDGKSFRLAAATFEPVPGELDPPLTPETVQIAVDRVMPDHGITPTTHWYRTRSLRAKGRYVALIMSMPPATGAIVLDEVEIYADTSTEPADPFPSPVFSEGKAGWKSHRLYRALAKRYAHDLAALQERIQNSQIDDAAKKSLLTQATRLAKKSARQPIPATDTFRAVYPLTDFHARLFTLQANLWQASGLSGLHAWTSHRPWFCFKEGVSGANWWAFGDGHGGFSWNEYFNSGTTLSSLYLGTDSITASKSMEAMREGAQDYELLVMLRQKAPGHDILQDGVDRVLTSHTMDQWLWNVPKDRSVADTVRERVLRVLSDHPNIEHRTLNIQRPREDASLYSWWFA